MVAVVVAVVVVVVMYFRAKVSNSGIFFGVGSQLARQDGSIVAADSSVAARTARRVVSIPKKYWLTL